MTFILKELQIELANEGIEQYCIESKLVTLEGDLSQSQMGLDLNDFTRLLTEIDVVIHNGAHVNHILSYAGKQILSNKTEFSMVFVHL